MKSQLLHRIIQRGVELIHRGLGFVAHVGEAEGGAFDFSVTAINEETLVFDQLLQFRHVNGATAGLRANDASSQRDRLKTFFGE